MNCKEFDDRIAEAVDKRLSADDVAKFMEHANACPPCRREFESHRELKSLISSAVKHHEVPTDVKARIARQINVLAEQKLLRFPFLANRRFVRPALAIGVAAAAVLLYLTLPGPISARDIIEQSVGNYAAVVNGSLAPQLLSAEYTAVERFFDGKTGFSVMVPHLRHCNLVGGIINTDDGIPLAHVVYTHSDATLIYVYEVCWDRVTENQFQLPDSVKEQLRRTQWAVVNGPDGHTLVLWLTGNTLCSAVARVPREALVACLMSDPTLQSPRLP